MLDVDDEVEVDAGVEPVDDDPDEGVDEPEEDEDSEAEVEVELVSLLVPEDSESPLPDELCEPAPLSCLPPADALGFERFGSFNLFE